jgi:hypothetical protein
LLLTTGKQPDVYDGAATALARSDDVAVEHADADAYVVAGLTPTLYTLRPAADVSAA